MKIMSKAVVFVLITGVLIQFSCKKSHQIISNKAPVAHAGIDYTINMPSDSAILDGSLSNDPDGSISSFLWTKISGPASFNITNSSNARTVVKNLAAGVYQFELKVTDNGGLFAKDTVRIILNDPAQPNRPPVANAGVDQTITLPANTVTIDGSACSDPEMNIISYTWTKISGPSSFNIGNANAVQTQVTNLVQAVYQFELKVTDAGGLFSKDTVQIIVNNSAVNQPPVAPVANAGPDQTLTLPLDSTYLDGSGSFPNGWTTSVTATFGWTQISGPSQILLSPATLLLPGYNPTTAFAKNLIPGVYLFRLQVTNSLGQSDADTIQVNVVDDPGNKNTVTYHDLLWEAGDVYGLGMVDISLTPSIRPDLFYSLNSYRPVQVYLKLESSSSWISVPYGGNSLYTYDEFPLLLWIICYPNNPSLVGTKSSIKIKFL